MGLGKAKYTLNKMCFPKVVIISFTVKEKPGPGLEVAVTADKRCASISPAHDGARGGRQAPSTPPERSQSQQQTRLLPDLSVPSKKKKIN